MSDFESPPTITDSRDPHAHARIDVLQEVLAAHLAGMYVSMNNTRAPNALTDYRDEVMTWFKEADKGVLRALGLSDD